MSTADLMRKYYGVFSRMGKTIDQKDGHTRQDREELLLGQRRSKTYTQNPEPSMPSKISLEEIDSMLRKSEQSEKKLRPSTVFRSQGREDYYKANAPKNNGPGSGHYNSNYSLVFKRPPTTFMNIRSKFKPKLQNKSPEPGSYHVSSTSHIQKIDFKKQLPRKFSSNQLNEKRFVSFNDKPCIHSKYKRVSTPEIGKGSKKRNPTKECLNSAIYDSKFDLVNKKTTSYDFAKSQGHQINIMKNIHDLNYDKISFKLVESNPPTYTINKAKKSAIGLPSHMTGNYNRLSMGMITEDSLKGNCSPLHARTKTDFAATMNDFTSIDGFKYQVELIL